MRINPFTRELFRIDTLIGRKKEITAFEQYLDGVPSVCLAAISARGLGKSSLFRKFGESAEKRKLLPVFVSAISNQSEEELFSSMVLQLTNAAIEKINTGLPWQRNKQLQFFESLRKQLHHCNVSDFQKHIFASYNQLKSSFYGLVIFIDDIESIRNPMHFIMSIKSIFDSIKKAGLPITFVFSSNVHFSVFSEFCSFIEIKPLSQAEIRQSISNALKPVKVEMGEECLNSIISDSEGNPLVLYNVCWTLFDRLKEKEKIITKFHYSAYMPSIMNNLSHAVFDDLYYRNSIGERKVLHTLASLGGEASTIEIAKKMKTKLNTVTTLLLRLSQNGSIIRTTRGRYKIFNRLYATYVKERVI